METHLPITKRVYPIFHEGDIFENFKATEPIPACWGWNDHSEHFNRLLNESSRLVIEVGTWLGNSALALCRAAKNAEVVCIDTWLGSREMWEDHSNARYTSLRHEAGYPQIYRSFLEIVTLHERQEQITPVPLPSAIAFEILRKHTLAPDLIYLDGSHEYQDVVRDIEDALSLNPRILCGDDYQSWDSVRTAVHDTIGTPQHEVGTPLTDGEFWWYYP